MTFLETSVPTSWKEFILQEQAKPYYYELVKRVQEDRKSGAVYPAEKDIFNAFKYCPLDKVKVVCLAMDPYINPNQAHGIAFSVPKDCPLPPSLKNIYKEIQDDLGGSATTIPLMHGCLIDWCKQGVFLLNAALTVQAGKSGSHSSIGWHTFTDGAIKLLNVQDRPIVYLLWGKDAKQKLSLITNPKALVLQSAHPSPYSVAGYRGCKHFSKANQYLKDNGLDPIDWSISP